MPCKIRVYTHIRERILLSRVPPRVMRRACKHGIYYLSLVNRFPRPGGVFAGPGVAIISAQTHAVTRVRIIMHMPAGSLVYEMRVPGPSDVPDRPRLRPHFRAAFLRATGLHYTAKCTRDALVTPPFLFTGKKKKRA